MVVSCARCGAYLVPAQTACPRCGLPRDAAPPSPPQYGAPPPYAAPHPYAAPPPGWGAPTPRRRRTGLVVGGSLVAVALLAGAGAWVLLRDGGGGAEAYSYGTDVELPAPAEDEPEEAWTYTPDAATAVSAYPDDTTVDDGVLVRWNRGAEYDSPTSMVVLDADGEEGWSADFEQASFISSITEDTALAYSFADVGSGAPGVVEVVESGTGEPLWDTEGTFAGASEEVALMSEDDGEGAVEALDRETGEQLWTADDVLTVGFSAEGDFVLLGDDGVRRVDGRTGEERWRITPEGEQPGVVVAGEMVLLGSEDGTQALDLGDGETLWSDDSVTELVAAWTLRDGRVLGATAYSVTAGESGPDDRTGWVLDREGPVGDELTLPEGRDAPWSWEDGEELLAAGGVLYDEDLDVLTSEYVSVLPTTDGFYGVAQDGTVSYLEGLDTIASPEWSAPLTGDEDAAGTVTAVPDGLVLVEDGTVRCLR
ncbi:PQQ-binding-like beta-propeller repeat protein [Nocardioides sp. CFH 31398]|uniref:outer membrane protein assembly factor BamB family protein n=1 Tax=Nocardioides sp. CFH 31398 TaxID=2919579 RepID=UPI001F069BB8|nr:PQQ-binding-like beta-propeller repeat protein [Nocardioides sp. CFH 31398]MCH1865119.1 PQQ-like beta-propeller repeat protein [Nocardioides sp. CFH 31398]